MCDFEEMEYQDMDLSQFDSLAEELVALYRPEEIPKQIARIFRYEERKVAEIFNALYLEFETPLLLATKITLMATKKAKRWQSRWSRLKCSIIYSLKEKLGLYY